MAKIEDGGPAFPLGPHQLAGGLETLPQFGMTKREVFAMAVLPAIMEMDGIQYVARYAEHADRAVKQADALLAALAHAGAK